MEVNRMNKGGFSWKTLLGVERKVGRMVLDLLFGKKKKG